MRNTYSQSEEVHNNQQIFLLDRRIFRLQNLHNLSANHAKKHIENCLDQ
jgi:hypothetical protein